MGGFFGFLRSKMKKMAGLVQAARKDIETQIITDNNNYHRDPEQFLSLSTFQFSRAHSCDHSPFLKSLLKSPTHACEVFTDLILIIFLVTLFVYISQHHRLSQLRLRQ